MIFRSRSHFPTLCLRSDLPVCIHHLRLFCLSFFAFVTKQSPELCRSVRIYIADLLNNIVSALIEPITHHLMRHLDTLLCVELTFEGYISLMSFE